MLNLLCEHLEFAPCTEHNRISTYDPHLKRLGADRTWRTCYGIELTGKPLPIHHQNAFPLVMRPGLQDERATPTATPKSRSSGWRSGITLARSSCR